MAARRASCDPSSKVTPNHRLGGRPPSTPARADFSASATTRRRFATQLWVDLAFVLSGTPVTRCRRAGGRRTGSAAGVITFGSQGVLVVDAASAPALDPGKGRRSTAHHRLRRAFISFLAAWWRTATSSRPPVRQVGGVLPTAWPCPCRLRLRHLAAVLGTRKPITIRAAPAARRRRPCACRRAMAIPPKRPSAPRRAFADPARLV